MFFHKIGGKLLFDPRLSASGVFSCNSCHNLVTGGDDNLETSIGHGWQRGPINALTVLNVVLNEAKGPIQAGVEMVNAPAQVVATLQSMPACVPHFRVTFPDEAKLITPAPPAIRVGMSAGMAPTRSG